MSEEEQDNSVNDAFAQILGQDDKDGAKNENKTENTSDDGKDATVVAPLPLTQLDHGNSKRPHRRNDEKNDKDKGKTNKKKKLMIAGGIMLAIIIILAGIYAYGVSKYTTHLFPNTTVDGINIGGMTVGGAEKATDTSNWNITIKDITGDTTTLDTKQVGLKISGETPQQMLDEQNPYEWPLHLSSANASTQRTTEYDADTLKATIDGLDMTDKDKRTSPTDATYRHDRTDGQWYVVPDTQGNLVDADKLYDAVSKSIDGLNQATVEVTQDMLVQPTVTSSNESLNTAIADANKWSKASMTYDIDDIDSAETLDSSIIAGWVSITQNEDGTFSAVLDETSIKAYLATIGKKYDTQGNPVTITTPDGKTVSVPRTEQNTGWITDETGEYDKLVADIKEGKTEHREFTMKQRASNKTGADIWGTTYIEVDLSSQHCWYIENGTVKASFGIISGKSGYDTPTGVTKVYKKVTDIILISPWKDPTTGKPTYKTHIDVGLVISADGGILIHDAPWQPESGFGKASYHYSGGSHGCVNARASDTWNLYNIVATGTPVVTHN